MEKRLQMNHSYGANFKIMLFRVSTYVKIGGSFDE